VTDHRIIFGDALEVLRTLPSESVDCCCTSPPYWGLRDYGVEGQVGLERTPQDYVARLVAVFAEVRRVLKPTGTLWLNLGDSYYGPQGRGEGKGNESRQRVAQAKGDFLKPKDLVGVPWRVALALQADGWWLRNDIVWCKVNALPESVTDRFSSKHEHVFLLAKNSRYWFDLDAVREPHTSTDRPPGNKSKARFDGDHFYRPALDQSFNPLGKNPGNVWAIATYPTPYAHFAMWAPALVERMLLAGCPPRVCAKCGKPWTRVTETREGDPHEHYTGTARHDYAVAGAQDPSESKRRILAAMAREVRTVGWQPTCDCQAAYESGVVLDPFLGSATTTQVARKLQRRSIGIELNSAYEAVMRQRLGVVVGALFSDVEFVEVGSQEEVNHPSNHNSE